MTGAKLKGRDSVLSSSTALVMGMDSARYAKLWRLLRSLPENISRHFETCHRLAFLLQWGRGGCTVWERHRLDTATLLPRGGGSDTGGGSRGWIPRGTSTFKDL